MIDELKAALASRGIELVHAVDRREALRLVLERIPKGIDLQVVMDQSVYVRSAIESLFHESVLGAERQHGA